MLMHFMTRTSPELLRCCCHATECVGLVVEAAGKEATGELLPRFMELGVAVFRTEHHENREYAHGMFAHVARALEEVSCCCCC